MPSFAHVTRIHVALLATPITLQLGTIGSCSIMNFGARVTMKAPGKFCNIYVDIANFDCYDMSVGTQFMRAHNVLLDFQNDQVVINGVVTPAHKQRNLQPPKLTEGNISHLWQQWYNEFQDVVNGTKEELPPCQEVNHEINLIDETKQYSYFMPKCSKSLQQQLQDKIDCYVQAKWWEPCVADQAAPLLCIPKKDGSLQTVLDAHQCNDNKVKDVTPLPDQEVIREDVAQVSVRSKFDFTDAYEQVRIHTSDIPKTIMDHKALEFLRLNRIYCPVMGVRLSNLTETFSIFWATCDWEMVTKLLDQAHCVVGHFGTQRTTEYLCCWYWWPTVVADAHAFCTTCQLCQWAKRSNQLPSGKLNSLPVPVKQWDSIGMDFIGPFLESKGFNYLWVVICCMTSMVTFYGRTAGWATSLLTPTPCGDVPALPSVQHDQANTSPKGSYSRATPSTPATSGSGQ
ncbi:Pro-Pol polyprotein [Termitomyces sp. J132]|nr:Pro-Pol polyprotein [Termitomyces sp. J132]